MRPGRRHLGVRLAAITPLGPNGQGNPHAPDGDLQYRCRLVGPEHLDPIGGANQTQRQEPETDSHCCERDIPASLVDRCQQAQTQHEMQHVQQRIEIEAEATATSTAEQVAGAEAKAQELISAAEERAAAVDAEAQESAASAASRAEEIIDGARQQAETESTAAAASRIA